MILFPKYPQGRRNVIRDEETGPHQVFLIIKSKTCFFKRPFKVELLQVGIFFALNFLPWEFLLIKKLEIEKLRPPSIQLLKLI